MSTQRETRRSSRIKQSKQSLLEETRLTSAAKVTRKTKKSTVANKDTEAATNDTRVHSSHAGEENQDDGSATTIKFRLACGPCGRF